MKMFNIMDPVTENTFMTKFYHALNSPLYLRCAELTVLLDRSQPKELQNIFPVLVDNIFGSSGTVGWGLRSITPESHTKEFKSLHHFFSPMGPMFRLIYKLLGESSLKYDYSLEQLPIKVKSTLENGQGHIPPFYNDLICQDMQTRQLICLKLNPFDYYMFHFAWSLVSPWQQRATIFPWGIWNTVYSVLCCDYLIHFLPTDPLCPVPLPHVPPHFTGKNPMVNPLQMANRNVRISKLFLPQVLQQATLEMSALHQNCQQHPRSEIWRTETVIQVFIDLWLNSDQFISPLDRTFNRSTQANELPSGEYVRIIRVVVKQLHSFAASGKGDITPMGELKKAVLPMFQGKMYIFLRHLIHRWPLDGSFRLVLELWLSFIQPWRYLGDKSPDKKPGRESEEIHVPSPVVDREYLRFMAENLLAYTIMFQQLLPRFLRIDLSSPKNATMIFRVTKVFAQQNLVPMLQEIEGCIDNRNHSPSHSYGGIWSPSLPPLSPTSNWSTNTPIPPTNSPDCGVYSGYMSPQKSPPKEQTLTNTPIKDGKWTAIVRQHIFDLEGPEFYYKPMFTHPPALEVMQLAHSLQQAIMLVNHNLEVKRQKLDAQHRGVLGFLKSIFIAPSETVDEFTAEERKTVPVSLQLALEYLKRIFNLDQTALQFPVEEFISEQNGTMNSSGFSNSSQMNLNTSMAPAVVRKRAATIRYEGDPDLMPVRSNECGFLVSLFYTICNKFNDSFAEEIRDVFHRPDFYGRLSRQVLQPPRIIHVYHRSSHSMTGAISPRIERILPPRLSLRTLASYTFITYFVLLMVIGRWMLQCNYMLLVFIFFSLYALVIIFKAFIANENGESPRRT